jgi:hypothetical protein
MGTTIRVAVRAAAVTAVLIGGSASASPEPPEGRDEAFADVERFGTAAHNRGEWSLAPGRVTPPTHAARRHSGFYLRPDLGVGYLSIASGGGASELAASGLAGFFGLHVGASVSDDLILAAHLFTGAASDPELTVGGASPGLSDASVGVVGIGPELTWYFTPSNAYVTASVAVTRLTLDTPVLDETSDAGLGGRLGIGKEWWVSRSWGLGLVGHVTLSSNEVEVLESRRFTTWGAGLAFSATYN